MFSNNTLILQEEASLCVAELLFLCPIEEKKDEFIENSYFLLANCYGIHLSVVALIYHILSKPSIISVHYKNNMNQTFDFTENGLYQSVLHKKIPSNLAYHLIQ